MKKVYPWRRFWVREGTDLRLDDDAYLFDPEGEYSRLMNDGISTFADLCGEPCNILLGEPGMGKSSSLRSDCQELSNVWAAADEMGVLIDLGAVASLTDLRKQITENSTVRNWAGGNRILHLCLDSLDEAVPKYPGLPKALVGVIGEFPKERLRLAVACRAGELPPYLENALVDQFGKDGVAKWHMAPLRRKDVHIAAAENDLDPEHFLEAVWGREVQPLAARPITLEFLLGEAVSEAELPTDIWLLYERGCRHLLCEPSDSSRFTQPQPLDVDQKMAVVGRIACITIFGAYHAVETDPSAPSQGGVVASGNIAGGREIANGNCFSLTAAEIQDVLRSGLFTASGLRFRWSHKSYAEFLAAYHLRANSVSRKQIVSLIGCAGRVAPALRGVAAWLTSREDEIFREVLKVDPEVLLFSDLSAAKDEQKGQIVDWLLRQAEADNPLVHEWGIFWYFRKLRHARLKEQLERVIAGTAGGSARYCAIEIAYACGGVGLQHLLSDLALLETEPMHLRIAAAWCVADHGEGIEKARLVPLALRTASTDEEERLQAQALSAAWPEHCTWAQVRDGLGMENPSRTSPVGRFLAHDFAEGLPDSDLAEVLGWLAPKRWAPDGLSAWPTATDELLARAARRTDDPAVRRAVVDVLSERLSKWHRVFSDFGSGRSGTVGPWPVDARRAIAAELMPRLDASSFSAAAALRGPNPLLCRNDVEFAIERWSAAQADEQAVWQVVIGMLVNWHEARDYAPVLARARKHRGLGPILANWRRSARRMADREQRLRAKQERHRQRKSGERIAALRNLLLRAETEPKYFGELLYTMGFPLDQDYAAGAFQPDVRELPGWHVLTQEEQNRLIAAGKRFLEEGRPYSLLGLLRGGPTRNAAAGYRVLRLLTTLGPSYPQELSAGIWQRWIPEIVLCQCDLSDKEYLDADRQLLRLSAAKAEGHLMRTLAIILRTRRTYGAERELERLAEVDNSKAFDSTVLASIVRPRVPQESYLTGMRILLQRSHEGARRTAKEAPGKVPTATADELPRLALNSALWLEHDRGVAWPAVWTQMRARPEFARLLLGVPGREGRALRHLTEWLTDDQLGELYLWLRNVFGVGPGIPASWSEPEFAYQGAILAALQQKGNADSVAVLEHIENAHPDDWQVRKAAWDARRLQLERSWEPLDPAVVKRIVEDRRQLLVRDDPELMEAVLEALQEYQAAIRAEGSGVMRLWNEPVRGPHTPKPEESLSREIGAELQRILSSRGVKATLEAKVREGQFVDIYVSATAADSKRRSLSLIIEVKGCWHEDLKTALDTQLAGRYLKDNQSGLGIYLAVWFLCDRWDGSEDPRKKKTPRESPSEIRAFLEAQAQRVNAETQSAIRVFVLDATIEGPPRKLKRVRRT